MTRVRLILMVAALLSGSAPAADTITVTGGKHDLKNVVCRISYGESDTGRYIANALIRKDGTVIPISFRVGHSLFGKGHFEGVFILPDLKAGETLHLTTADRVLTTPVFDWRQSADEFFELTHGDRRVLRFMKSAHDASTKDRHELTFKPFHHVYDPKTGTTLLTNGAGLASNKELTYPHHRGLFFGFNRITYNGQEADVWHGRNGEFQTMKRNSMQNTSRVWSWHQAEICWHGRDGREFATETREVQVFDVPGGTLIDFASVLTTTLPKVRLDGDPQHAGFHFRAANEVSKNGKDNTYYLRPDGKGQIGETRNWDPKTRKGPVNLPWDACSFVIGGKRYTVLRLNHPDNPGEARGSERDYGRFGDYFEYDLTPDKPLKVKYRVWVQEGEMTVAQCENFHRGFVSPPAVK